MIKSDIIRWLEKQQEEVQGRYMDAEEANKVEQMAQIEELEDRIMEAIDAVQAI